MQPPTSVANEPWPLVAMAIAGQLLTALITLRLARDLSADEFEAYAVAVAAFLLLVAAAPMGAERLALRVLPPLVERGDWQRVGGYLRFALRHAVLGTILVGAVGLAWAFGIRDLSAAVQGAFLFAILALPLGVLAKLGLEVLTAAGAARFATGIMRLGVPMIVLGLLLLLPALGTPLDGAIATAVWGAGWAIAAIAFILWLRAATPLRVRRIAPEPEDGAWRRAAGPFWIHRIAMAVMAQSGIIGLDWAGASPAAVGAYAAASTVVGLGLVLSTSTSRDYARRISILIERRSGADVMDLARQRRRWLLPVLALFVAVVFVLSPQILALFSADFVEEGLWALRILVITTAFSMSFALAPTVLKYRARNRATLGLVAGAAALQIALLALLAPALAATGAALAYALSVIVLYGSLARLARRDLARLA